MQSPFLFQVTEGRAEVLSVDDVGQGSFVHVEDDEEFIGNEKELLGLRCVGNGVVVHGIGRIGSEWRREGSGEAGVQGVLSGRVVTAQTFVIEFVPSQIPTP